MGGGMLDILGATFYELLPMGRVIGRASNFCCVNIPLIFYSKFFAVSLKLVRVLQFKEGLFIVKRSKNFQVFCIIFFKGVGMEKKP